MAVRSVPRLSAVCCGLLLAGLTAVACSGPATPSTSGVPPTTDPIAPVSFEAVFVVNGGDSSLSVINTETNEVAGTVRFHGVEFPHHVYLSADHSKMLVAVPGTDLSAGHDSSAGHNHGSTVGGSPGAVLMLEASSGRLIAARRTDAMNHNAIYAPNGTEVWTAQHDGRVLVLDGTTLETRQSIGVGLQPSEITFSGDGRNAFVADTGSAAISIIDPATKKQTKVIPVGADPVGAWQGTNGIAYVDNESDGTISAIDTASLEVVATWRLGFTPGMVAFGPDGNVWVADPYNAQVVIRRPLEDLVVGTAPAGQGAHAIVFSIDGKTAYVSDQGADTVSVIDVATLQKVKTIGVGSKPNGMVTRQKD
jgi:YVTN family beta-propeller protein